MDSQIAKGPTLAAAATAAGGDRLPAGAAVGDYEIDGFLGAGAMGEVYAARHPVIGKRVAIKVLRRELSGTVEGAERFVREARAANRVSHPNVIDVFGFGRLEDGRLYLAMDLVEGRSLRRRLEAGPLEAGEALAILEQIAAALDAAHAHGVVHRDLKPDNVMLEEPPAGAAGAAAAAAAAAGAAGAAGAAAAPAAPAAPGRVHVLDFGIAKLLEQGGAAAPGTLTGQGAWLGTPAYMAPEQWSADGAGPASDRYALGVMAFELLSGKLPFQAASLPQLMEQHFRAPVPALTTRGAADAHAAFDPVLSRAMAKAPEERYATAAELVAALRAAAGGGGPGRAARAGRRPWLPAAAGAGVLGLAVAAVVAARGGGGEGEARPAPGPGSEPRPEPQPEARPAPPAGLARVEVTTRPAGAAVRRGDQLLGATPASIEVRIGEPVTLELRKPGYATIRRELAAPDAAARVDVELAPQNGFEGVWALPDGQLRAFRRSGELVDVFKLKAVAGERELYRRIPLEEPPAGSEDVVFAGSEVVTDGRGARDPSCQIPHRVEYRYDPARDALEVRPEQVRIGVAGGRCVVREKLPGEPLVLVRADRGPDDDGRWSRAPVGRPRLEGKAPPDRGNARPVSNKPAPDRANVKRVPSKPAPSKPGLVEPAQGQAKTAPPPAPTPVEPPPAQAPQAQAPPAQAPQAQAPQAQAPPLPRGDSQVAPQTNQEPPSQIAPKQRKE